MSDANKPVTEKRLKLLLDEALKNYATKDDLNSRTNEILEVLSQFMQQSTVQHQELKDELRSYAGVLIEAAEERFLKTGHDKVSVCEDRLDQHEARLNRLESVAY